jgi:hypothetical protein
MRRQRRTSVGRMETNKLKRSAEARAQDTHKQVQALIASVNERVRDPNAEYGVDDAIEELDAAKRLAMLTGHAGAAVAAIMGKCKLKGLIIDRSAQIVGKPEDFASGPQSIDDLVEDMRETLGSRAVGRFIDLLRGMGIEYRGDDRVIDGETR